MASKIDPTQINTGYPIPGINQSSAGFRSNFSTIRTQFVTAGQEISEIQATPITVSGDLTLSGSLTLGQSSGINLDLTLNNILSNQINIDTSNQDISFTVGTNGLITSINSTSKPKYTGGSSTSYTVTQNPVDSTYPDSTGISSITVPILTISEYGAIETQATETLTGFGLLGYPMPEGSLLTGSSSNLSTFLPKGSNGQFLVANDTSTTGLSWETVTYGQGNVMAVGTGPGLSNSGSDTNPVIDLDIDSLSSATSLLSTDEILISRGTTPFKATLSNLESLYDGVYLKSVSQDTAPALGGNLNVGNYEIETSSGNLVLNSSNGNVVLNNFTFPNNPSAWSSGLYLSVDSLGHGEWAHLPSSIMSITGESGISVSTDSSGYATIGFNPSTLTAGTTIPTGSDMIVYDGSTASTTMVPISVLESNISGNIQDNLISTTGENEFINLGVVENTVTSYTIETLYPFMQLIVYTTNLTILIPAPENLHNGYNFKLMIVLGIDMPEFILGFKVNPVNDVVIPVNPVPGVDISGPVGSATTAKIYELSWIPEVIDPPSLYSYWWLCTNSYTTVWSDNYYTIQQDTKYMPSNLCLGMSDTSKMATGGDTKSIQFLTGGFDSVSKYNIYGESTITAAFNPNSTSTNNLNDMSISANSFTIPETTCTGQLNINSGFLSLGTYNSGKAKYVTIGTYTNGGEVYDSEIIFSGGSTSSSGKGTIDIICQTLVSGATTVNFTYATSGLLCPSTSNNGLTLADNSTKAATTEWCNAKFALASSSMLLKDDIKESPLSTLDALDTIKNIPLKSFTWKDNEKNVSMGMITEDLEKICPELINKNEHSVDSVNFLNLMARMVGAIQELSDKVNYLESKI